MSLQTFITLAGPNALPSEVWQLIITRWHPLAGWQYLQKRKALPHKTRQANMTPNTCTICRILWYTWQQTDLSSHMLKFTDEATWQAHDTWCHNDLMTDIDTRIQFSIMSKPRRQYQGYLIKWSFPGTTHYLEMPWPLMNICVSMIACVGKHTVQVLLLPSYQHTEYSEYSSINLTYDIGSEEIWVSRQSFKTSPLRVVEFHRASPALYGSPKGLTFGHPRDVLKWEELQVEAI